MEQSERLDRRTRASRRSHKPRRPPRQLSIYAANRRTIKESRIQSTVLLGQAVACLARPPCLWMNPSTATIYRHALSRSVEEDTGEIGGKQPDCPCGGRFSIDVATSREKSLFLHSRPALAKSLRQAWGTRVGLPALPPM